ncbi:hypothetical protein EYR41_011906 [Orbilia oligospora]|uniref:Uncharacterized protein n=1 Tax=Orbilia oligospora TaxID=2813651 RepID=A0A8H2HKM1_ORBOL|nr:hypothetical protein EYR41_011906 [Orbilia oligospora]
MSTYVSYDELNTANVGGSRARLAKWYGAYSCFDRGLEATERRILVTRLGNFDQVPAKWLRDRRGFKAAKEIQQDIQRHNDYYLGGSSNTATVDPDLREELEVIWIATQKQIEELDLEEGRVSNSITVSSKYLVEYFFEKCLAQIGPESLNMRLYVAHSEIEQAHALLYLPSKATSSKGEKILRAGVLQTRKLLEDLPHGDGDRRILLFNFIYYLYNNAKIKADRADGNSGSGDDDGIDVALDEAIEFVEEGILEVDKDEDVLLLAAFMSKLLQLRYRRQHKRPATSGNLDRAANAPELT